MSEKWCEHIIDIGGTYFLFQKGEVDQCATKTNVGVQEFSFCPICGTTRPPEKKKLWEVLQDAWHEPQSPSSFEDGYRNEAQAAIKEVERVIDEYFSNGNYGQIGDALKQKVRELL